MPAERTRTPGEIQQDVIDDLRSQLAALSAERDAQREADAKVCESLRRGRPGDAVWNALTEAAAAIRRGEQL